MKRGDVACFTSNEIFYVKWMDNKAVYMASNYLSGFPISDIKRRKKRSSQKDNSSALQLSNSITSTWVE